MTQEIIDMAQECGLIGMRPYIDGIYSEALVAFAKLVAEKALAEHAMQEVQRLGQEIEQELKIKTTDPFESSRVADYNRGWNDCLFASGIVKQPEQELVAIKRMKEWIEYLKRKSDFGQHMKIPSEMSAGACWELAIELEQFINTTPPQRTWVELSDEQIEDCYKQGGIGRAIQLFKEKNT